MKENTMQDPAPAFDPEVADRELAALREVPLAATDKGFAGVTADIATTPASLVDAGACLAAYVFSTPLLVLRDSALQNNVDQMAQWCSRSSVLFSPHAKTTMSPELFVRQLRAGAWALTAANVTQAAVFARFGARRILIANEVADPTSVRALVELLDRIPGLEVAVYVDSAAGIEQLDGALAASGFRAGRLLPVLVELGRPGGRAGKATARLSVVGASCFEGVIGGGTDDDTLAKVRVFLSSVRALGEAIATAGLLGGGFGSTDPSLILSAGGSHYFDLVASEFAVPGARTVVRSGSYVVHDHGTYLTSTPALRGEGPRLVPAIEVRTTVLSRPEPELLLLNAGRRDVSFDSGLPLVLSARRGEAPVATGGATVFDLNDQHAFVRVPAGSDLAVGDTVTLGISHPCTTLDKWPHTVIADDADVVVGIAHSFF
jgi:D-serine deaminase-like pyridoxal phosphate-dependent protein